MKREGTMAFLKRVTEKEPRIAPDGPSRFKTPTGAEISAADALVEAGRRSVKQSAAQRWAEWWVIDPRNSKYLGYWDIFTVLALFFVALVTPFEVAFLDSPREAADIWHRFESVGWLFVVNRIVDLLFLADLILNFRLSYQDTNSTEGTRWVMEPWPIAKHYLKGWFALDSVSIAVCAFDIVPILNSGGSGGGGSASALRVGNALRVMRVLRLIKLIRLLRASRLFQRWETKIAINYSSLNLARSIFNVCYISHFFACIWGLLVALSDTKSTTWAGYFSYCRPYDELLPEDIEYRAIVASEYAPGDCVPDGPWALYSVSVYWAVMTITSIGYGDIHATDRNIAEQTINTLLMLVGAIIWGNLIGTFCGVVATMNPQSAEFTRRMDDLNRFVKTYDLDHDLRRRLREYLHQTRHLQVAASSKDLLTLLSPALQGEVTWATNKKWLMRVSFFAKAEPEFLVQISLSLTPLVFTPGELAINGYLYIVHRGIALYGGRVLTSGKVWGEDCIISSTNLQRKWCARAMNYLEVYMISRDDVLEVAAAFPRTYVMIRKTALRMAVRRQIILVAKMMAQAEGKEFGASKTKTFDKLLDQATAVPMSELRLQSTLTNNRLEVGPNMAMIKHANTDAVMSIGYDDEVGADASKASPSAAGASPALTVKTGSPKVPTSSGGGSVPPRSLTTSYGGSTPSEAARASKAAKGGVSESLLKVTEFLANKESSGEVGGASRMGGMGGASRMGAMGARMSAASPGGARDVSAEIEGAVSRAVASTRTELGGKIDAMGGRIDDLQRSVALILERLPAGGDAGAGAGAGASTAV